MPLAGAAMCLSPVATLYCGDASGPVVTYEEATPAQPAEHFCFQDRRPECDAKVADHQSQCCCQDLRAQCDIEVAQLQATFAAEVTALRSLYESQVANMRSVCDAKLSVLRHTRDTLEADVAAVMNENSALKEKCHNLEERCARQEHELTRLQQESEMDQLHMRFAASLQDAPADELQHAIATRARREDQGTNAGDLQHAIAAERPRQEQGSRGAPADQDASIPTVVPCRLAEVRTPAVLQEVGMIDASGALQQLKLSDGPGAQYKVTRSSSVPTRGSGLPASSGASPLTELSWCAASGAAPPMSARSQTPVIRSARNPVASWTPVFTGKDRGFETPPPAFMRMPPSLPGPVVVRRVSACHTPPMPSHNEAQRRVQHLCI